MNEDFIKITELLKKTIKDRRSEDTGISYTAKLFSKGSTKIAQKVGEEGLEVALAAVSGEQSKEDLVYEIADLWFHLLVLMEDQDVDFGVVAKELERRHKN